VQPGSRSRPAYQADLCRNRRGCAAGLKILNQERACDCDVRDCKQNLPEGWKGITSQDLGWEWMLRDRDASCCEGRKSRAQKGRHVLQSAVFTLHCSGLITRRRGALATWASWMERGLSACAESVLDRRSRARQARESRPQLPRHKRCWIFAFNCCSQVLSG